MSDTMRNLKAIGFVILGFGLFSINDALIKLLALSYSVPQTLFWTAFFVCPVLIGYGLITEGKSAFETKIWGWHFWRGLAMTCVVFCTLFALTQIEMTEFYAIVFTTPMIISLASWVFLKDKLSRPQVFTIIAGFLVILYMCRPGTELFNIGALSALGGAMFLSLASVLVRSHLREEKPLLVGINGPVVIAMVSFPLSLYYGFTFPTDMTSLGLFILSGITAGSAGVFFGKGFQYASSAAVVAPFHYTQMIWGTVLGYLIFEEVPSFEVIAGACMLAVLGVYLIYSESRARRRERTLVEKRDTVLHEPV
ncbi:MAG: DMT family transporter [Pseudomonadota bacterium]